MEADYIDRIKQEILSAKDSRVWVDFVRSLNLVSEKIFARSSHFLLEIVQNAEDVRASELNVHLSKHRVKVTHNGSPFLPENVSALCGIRTTKKPKEGTLGYLGIGFKSVYRITDCPEIYSGAFQFKFDREAWPSPREVPWQVIPVPISEPSEDIDPAQTTFILPLRDEEVYSSVVDEFTKLNVQLLLFLRWLSRITICDELSGKRQNWAKLDEKDGVVTLNYDEAEQSFRVFRQRCDVPEDVSRDRVTEACERHEVRSREVVIAFPLDKEGNLVPAEAAASYGGVYSFIPLGEERSGAKFWIHADFLVQPGREAINYDAKWNHWLVQKIAELSRNSVAYFKSQDPWCHQFLPLFDFRENYGEPSFERLFKPLLIDPLEGFLSEDPVIKTADNDFTTVSKAAIADDLTRQILEEAEISSLLGDEGLRYVNPKTKLGPLESKAKKVDFLSDFRSWLDKKRKETDAAQFTRKIYLQLFHHFKGYSESYFRYTLRPRYLTGSIILTEEGELVSPDSVYLPEFEPEVLTLLRKVPLPAVHFVHPRLFQEVSEGEKNDLNQFIREFLGVKPLDYQTLVRQSILPRISTTNVAPPPPQELIDFTRIVKKAVDKGLPLWEVPEIWVVSGREEPRRASEVYFTSKYRPTWNWEPNRKYVPSIDFISECYLDGLEDAVAIQAWYQFLRRAGVKDDHPRELVEEFAMNYVKGKIAADCLAEPEDVSDKDRGYDIEAMKKDGAKRYIEVKGLAYDRDIDLPPNETKSAQLHKGSYEVYIVSGIPMTPERYIIRNPIEHGYLDRLSLPQNIWKRFKV